MADEKTIFAMAEQACLYHLLVKILREQGYLQEGGTASRYNEAEFQQFLKDYKTRYFPDESFLRRTVLSWQFQSYQFFIKVSHVY